MKFLLFSFKPFINMLCVNSWCGHTTAFQISHVERGNRFRKEEKICFFYCCSWMIAGYISTKGSLTLHLNENKICSYPLFATHIQDKPHRPSIVRLALHQNPLESAKIQFQLRPIPSVDDRFVELRPVRIRWLVFVLELMCLSVLYELEINFFCTV